MRIGVDATCWTNPRGYGRFLRQLLGPLAATSPDEYLCFVDAPSAERFDLAAPNIRVVTVPLGHAPTQAAAADGYRAPLDLLRLTRAVSREPLDLFFCPTVYTYFPLPPRLRAVVTIHDAIAERFPSMTLPSRRARIFWGLKVRLALAQARVVLTVSDYAARDLVRVLGVRESRLRVAGEAAAPAFIPTEDPGQIRQAAERHGLPADARWLVYVGGFNPHKRIDVAIRAHAVVARELGARAPYLLLVGATDGDVFHHHREELVALIAEEGTGELVRWLGFVPDDELRHLHSGAVAALLLSEAEGFGLPAVEAAACGTPVVATTESPLPQLLEGGGMFVAPGDQGAVERALGELLAQPAHRDRLGRTALARAGALSWEASARAVHAALTEAAA